MFKTSFKQWSNTYDHSSMRGRKRVRENSWKKGTADKRKLLSVAIKPQREPVLVQVMGSHVPCAPQLTSCQLRTWCGISHWGVCMCVCVQITWWPRASSSHPWGYTGGCGVVDMVWVGVVLYSASSWTNSSYKTLL